ncbi:hypothetical protein CJU89_4702 [Yarrowia sp. B02]|nr:hypothetical protein CJU89_4702 [Yarrowia sp. B02]
MRQNYSARRSALLGALAITALVGWLLYPRGFDPAVLALGDINTEVVYRARVMPYVIDTERTCTVPRWLERGVYVAQEPCDDGLRPVDFGKTASKWTLAKESSQGHMAWKTSRVPAEEDPFVHALLQCQNGGHMACLIMDEAKGPFHSVEDPLTQLTEETLAPMTNEDTVHRCGESYRDCVVVPASIVEPLLLRNFSASFDDDAFQTVVKDARYFFRELVW